MGMNGKHLLDSVYPARGRSARHAERHVRHFRLIPSRRSILRSKSWNRKGCSRSSGGRGRGGRPIRLTETGMKLAEQTVDFVIEAEQRALLDLSSEEQAQLLTLMRRYNDALSPAISARLTRRTPMNKTAHSAFRPLHLSAIAALRRALHRHDDLHIHLLRGGRLLCLQLCRQNAVRGAEFHHAIHHGARAARASCSARAAARSSPRRLGCGHREKGQPHFHDDDRLRRGRRPGI